MDWVSVCPACLMETTRLNVMLTVRLPTSGSYLYSYCVPITGTIMQSTGDHLISICLD